VTGDRLTVTAASAGIAAMAVDSLVIAIVLIVAGAFANIVAFVVFGVNVIANFVAPLRIERDTGTSPL
jgi:hypothetical protein